MTSPPQIQTFGLFFSIAVHIGLANVWLLHDPKAITKSALDSAKTDGLFFGCSFVLQDKMSKKRIKKDLKWFIFAL
jgi:hypothetical protein